MHFLITLLIWAQFSVHAQSLTLEDIYLNGTYTFTSDSVIGWRDDTLLIRTPHTIETLNPKTGRKTVLINLDKLVLQGQKEPISFAHVLCDSSVTHFLFTDALPSRGVKTGGNVYYYNQHTSALRQLANVADDWSVLDISPDGSRLGFVKGNNLYSYELAKHTATQLTFDGSKDTLNGSFDWAYEEEFATIRGWKWSPNSRTMAYWQIDRSEEPLYPLLNYATPKPSVFWMHYPKAGDAIGMARIGLVDALNATHQWLTPPTDNAYIPRIHWAPEGHALYIQHLNRAQNHLQLEKIDLQRLSRSIVLEEKHSTWVDIHDSFIARPFDEFLWLSERDGYSHIYHSTNENLTQLTGGEVEVSRIVGSSDSRVYFEANFENVFETHYYSSEIWSGTTEKLTHTQGTHHVLASEDMKYFVDYHQNTSSPSTTSVYQSGHSEPLSSLTKTPTDWNTLTLGNVDFFSFKTSQGVLLNARRVLPPSFDANKTYAVLLNVYGGPGSQKATDSWVGLWDHFLAQEGYIVVSVDNRGTAGRGKAFKSQVYARLGTLESEDQIETAKYLAEQSWVDPSRVGIWGWSYGGYLAALTAARGGDLFKAAISVAPVTHWSFYDAPYTERYMGLPENNPEGYESSSPLNYLSTLTAPILVVHGTGDDNVHYQNSIELVHALINQNKDVETLIYPYQQHSINKGKFTRFHLYRKLLAYLKRNL